MLPSCSFLDSRFFLGVFRIPFDTIFPLSFFVLRIVNSTPFVILGVSRGGVVGLGLRKKQPIRLQWKNSCFVSSHSRLLSGVSREVGGSCVYLALVIVVGVCLILSPSFILAVSSVSSCQLPRSQRRRVVFPKTLGSLVLLPTFSRCRVLHHPF